MTKLPWFSIIILGCFVLLLGACGQAGVPILMDATQSPPATLLPAKPTQEDDMLKDSPLPAVPSQEDDMPKDPPLPFTANPGLQALIERAKADLAQRLSIPASQIKAIETKEVVWPDASLGCPQPGIVYAQIPTPGYIVMLENAGDNFEYHASIRGDTLYCENPTPPISGTPADIYPFR